MDKIRYGMIGCSNFLRRRIIDAVSKSTNSEIISLASRDINKAKEWSKEFDISYFDSYESILERKDIDAVYISLPIGLHKDLVIKATKAKKHVLCEKALAENYASVKTMVDACIHNNVHLYENHTIDNHTQHEKVRSMIKNGKIGKIFSFKSSFGFPAPKEGDIRYDKNLGGGILNDVGTYPLLISRLLFEEEPISVFCKLNLDKKTGVDMSGVAILEFPNKKRSLIDFGYDKLYQNNYSIWGSKGLIKVNRAYSINEDVYPNIDYIEESSNEITKIRVPPMNQYAESFNKFSSNILNNITRDYTGILNQARAMEALRMSSKLEKEILLYDLKK